MAGFHRFGDLPLELREQIWRLAIRPVRRGVHWFEYITHYGPEEPPTETEIPMEPWHEFRNRRLAAPKCEHIALASGPTDPRNEDSDGDAVSQEYHNPSTYNIDGGLWSACKESRLVIERYFRKLDQECFQPKRHGQGDDMNSGAGERLRYFTSHKSKTIATSYFITKQSEPHYFTVVPHADLFCFPPHLIATVDWEYFHLDLRFGSTRFDCEGICNIAFVYQPEWGKEWMEKGGSDIFTALVDLALDVGEVQNIWLIDTSIKRACHVPSDGKARKAPAVFMAADRQLEEVFNGFKHQPGWEYTAWTEDDRRVPNSIDFVSELDLHITVAEEEANYWDIRPLGRANVGVLACEYF